MTVERRVKEVFVDMCTKNFDSRINGYWVGIYPDARGNGPDASTAVEAAMSSLWPVPAFAQTLGHIDEVPLTEDERKEIRVRLQEVADAAVLAPERWPSVTSVTGEDFFIRDQMLCATGIAHILRQ